MKVYEVAERAGYPTPIISTANFASTSACPRPLIVRNKMGVYELEVRL
jgi:hypothetical protein